MQQYEWRDRPACGPYLVCTAAVDEFVFDKSVIDDDAVEDVRRPPTPTEDQGLPADLMVALAASLPASPLAHPPAPRAKRPRAKTAARRAKTARRKRDYTNVKRPVCAAPGCAARAYYGARCRARGAPLYCARHKEKGHTNVKNRVCVAPGCSTQASFGAPLPSAVASRGRAQYCAAHKKSGAAPLQSSRRCCEPGCAERACFGAADNRPIWQRARFCARHKEPGCVNIRNWFRRCAEPGCPRRAAFGAAGECSLFCSAHRHDDHVCRPRRAARPPTAL